MHDQITVLQSYEVTWMYVNFYYFTFFVQDLASLASEMPLTLQGKSLDPAAWDRWCDLVCVYKNVQKETLLENALESNSIFLTKDEAFKLMQMYVQKYDAISEATSNLFVQFHATKDSIEYQRAYNYWIACVQKIQTQPVGFVSCMSYMLENVKLLQSYEIAFTYLRRYFFKKFSHSVGELIGGMYILNSGKSLDLKMWNLWLRSLSILESYQPFSDCDLTIRKPLVLQGLYTFVNEYQKSQEFQTPAVDSLIIFLKDAVHNNDDCFYVIAEESFQRSIMQYNCLASNIAWKDRQWSECK